MQDLRRNEDARQRRWLPAVLALSLFAFCGVPLANLAHSVDETSPLPPAPPAVPGRIRYPAPDVRRDPFIPDDSMAAGNATSRDDAGGIVLPPNAGAGQSGGSAPLLRGVVLGLQPSALVEIGGSRSVIVKVGSALLGSSVTSIGKNGVLLEDGEELRFPERRP